MITEYERKQCDHPIIKEILLWHDEAWLDGKQLEALLGISRSKLKRLLQRIHTESEIDYHHSEVFSVVRQRYHKGKQKKSDWVYQIRYYDTKMVRLLASYCDEGVAYSFLEWLGKAS